MHTYLFEAKSIQSYLFSSGKLKDVIAASERLDRLIDSNETSTLYQVLESAGLQHDLIAIDATPELKSKIHFLRCKGGAFYAYCETVEPLQALRSLWTLTIAQMFPSMEYSDSLTTAETLAESLDLGHQQLAWSRNTPKVNLPYAKAPHARCARTGKVATPVSRLASRAKHREEDAHLDVDTELHRQAYQALEMRDNAALQDRFTPDKLRGRLTYPIDFETQFPYFDEEVSSDREKQSAIKDMALIHIDGNGLGLVLIALKEILIGKSAQDYCQVFRAFSEALNHATVDAAKVATQELYEQCNIHNSDSQITLPMRPIVLGGDDITLFCRADLAMNYGKTFCHQFETQSRKHLQPLFSKYLREASISPYLTASGGILFHKASHPFMHSHHLVEALCSKAKKLTKSVDANNKAGPSALAVYRVSNATQSNIDDLLDRSSVFSLSGNKLIKTANNAYFIDQQSEKKEISFAHLDAIIRVSNHAQAPVSMNRWRQMATEISVGDFDEAQRIFYRGMELCKNANLKEQLIDALTACNPANQEGNWYWPSPTGNALETIIHDLLILDHYRLDSVYQPSQGEPA